MLFDLLHLARDIGQSMELYSSLRLHQQQASNRQHQNDDSPRSQLTSKQPQIQCKPLDLSLRSKASSARAPSNRLRHIKPAPIPLVPNLAQLVDTTDSERDPLVANLREQVRSKKQHQLDAHHSHTLKVTSQQAKLITSSTSPSSCSHSASSVSSVESKSNEVISSSSVKRQKHKGLKCHLCNQCGRSFSRSDMLTRHSRLHSGLKPYQCSKCKQVFSRSDHLSTHERTHTGEKPYQCERCNYSACRRDMITRHMRTHSASNQRIKSPKLKFKHQHSDSSPTDNQPSVEVDLELDHQGDISTSLDGGDTSSGEENANLDSEFT